MFNLEILNNFVFLMKSHLVSYPCPLQINTLWNYGFLLAIAMIIQIVTGLFLAIFYCADVYLAFYSIYYLIREVFYGYLLRSFHANGASFIFFLSYIHISRSIFFCSFIFNPHSFSSGTLIFFALMATAFMGYVLPFGQMSFWGATVICNLLSPIPIIVEYLSGGFCINNATTKRFFILHFILPFLILAIVACHIFFLHYMSSANPLYISTNNKIPFYPYLVLKDSFTLFLLLMIYFLQCHFGILTLSHPDNSMEANPLVTPAHIVPEWYFLVQYAMLKGIPDKNSGFGVLVTSISYLLSLIEIPRVSTVYDNPKRSQFCIYLANVSLALLFIGAQFPIGTLVEIGRDLNLLYYGLVSGMHLTQSYCDHNVALATGHST